MTRLSQILFAAAAISAVPLTAFAQDPVTDPPVDPNAGTGVPPVEGTGGTAPAWSSSAIDRPLTVLKGKLGASADLVIYHVSPPPILGVEQDSSTNELLAVGAGYGITDKLEVGGSYMFSLNEFEIKGILTAYGAFALMHSDKLDIGASADIALNLANEDAMGDSQVQAELHAGAAVRYKITPKMAVFTGTPSRILNQVGLLPAASGPLGQHLTIGISDGTSSSFSLPVGFGFQATPQLFAYVNTNLLNITLSDVPDGADRVSSIADYTPLALGALFSINKNIDAAASIGFYDLQNAGDILTFGIGARYYN
jgi:hypothetical protein